MISLFGGDQEWSFRVVAFWAMMVIADWTSSTADPAGFHVDAGEQCPHGLDAAPATRRAAETTISLPRRARPRCSL
jgi:hypothetical protein